MVKRNYIFDILKMIGLLGIIIAHINPSEIIFEIRNFDVILMIMISVMLSLNKISDKVVDIKCIKKRIVRLLKPTYIFLTVYFLIYFIVLKSFDIKKILASYLLIGGIGYVWIIRIYIYIAILIPIISYFYKKKRKSIYYFNIVGIYIIYFILTNLENRLDGPIQVLFRAIVLDFIGYGLIVMIFVGIKQESEKQVLKNALVFCGVFIFLSIYNNFQSIQNFKYPLSLYYISYGIGISLLLYIILSKFKLEESCFTKIALYFSNNSMWIYLWHIIYIPIVLKLNVGWILRFIIIVLASIITIETINKVFRGLKQLKEKFEKKKISEG
ncbi:MAG: acyltransferase family protein [Sarcina sp.]